MPETERLRRIRQALLATAEHEDLPLTVRQVELLARTVEIAVRLPRGRQPRDRVHLPDGRTMHQGQVDVLRLAAANLSNQEIADRLAMSMDTVRSRMSAAYKVLGVRGRTQAVALGLEQGWIAPEDLDPMPRPEPGDGAP